MDTWLTAMITFQDNIFSVNGAGSTGYQKWNDPQFILYTENQFYLYCASKYEI